MLSVKIINDMTGTDDSANYKYDVMVNDRRILAQGRVCGHNRKDPWNMLLQRIADESFPKNVEGLVREFRYYQEVAIKFSEMLGEILDLNSTKAYMPVVTYKKAVELYAEFVGENPSDEMERQPNNEMQCDLCPLA